MKRRILFCLFAIIIISIIVTSIVYLNNFKVVLNKAGLSKDLINYVDVGIDDNGNEYRIAFQYMPENVLKFVHLVKDKYGMWKVTNEVNGPDSHSQFVAMGWMRFASIGRYDLESQTNFEFEVHALYGGNNASKQIKIPLELLPANVSVNVFQAGEIYVIHFIAFGNADILSQVDLYYLLEQTGSIH